MSVNYQLLIEKKLVEDQKLEKLRSERTRLDNLIQDGEETLAKNVFSSFTLEDLEKMWNESDNVQRLTILDLNPDVVAQVEKLDSHGGLRETEIYEEIIQEEWDCAYWINHTECFESYCKKSEDDD